MGALDFFAWRKVLSGWMSSRLARGGSRGTGSFGVTSFINDCGYFGGSHLDDT